MGVSAAKCWAISGVLIGSGYLGIYIFNQNSKFKKFLFPGETESVDAQNAIGLHEYFVSLYQKKINKNLVSNDRSFCEKIKKRIK